MAYTFAEMKQEVFGMLGNFSALNPASDAQGRIARWINSGYKKILTWKLRSGRQLRFRCTEGELFFTTVLLTGTAQDGGASTITLGAGSGTSDDQYNGYVVEISGGTGSGQKRVIMDYNGGTLVATVHKAWTTNPDSTSTYKLYKRFMRLCYAGQTDAGNNITLDPRESVYHVLKVSDMNAGQDLEVADRIENWTNVMAEPGTPAAYLTFGDKIVFDVPIDEARYYRLEYFRMPADLSGDTDQPEVPEPWDEAIIQWAVWRGLRYTQEPAMAYAAKADLNEFIESIVPQEAVGDERENAYAYIDFGR